MNFISKSIRTSALIAACWALALPAAVTRQYFAWPGVEDKHGIIAPWYNGQNGQCDWRVRIAAETLKRYPWAEPPLAVMPAPHYVFNGHWAIKPDGTILVDPQLLDWHNGDVGQRSVSLIWGLSDYYRYSGDAGVIGPITCVADYLLDYCQTPADHPWPGFPISAPTKGKAYGQADPHGFIQLDLSAQLGSAMIVAYKLTGVSRYRDAALHWADLLAEHCQPQPAVSPWNRYANPEDSKWDTRQTGGVSLILQFLDDVVRLGYTGKNNAIITARDAGEAYLRDELLNGWSDDPTFGHHFWDWLNPVATCAVPCYTAQYIMNRPHAFPLWKTDLRNMLSLFFSRASVNPASSGDVYSGAWAFPEASNCCGKSLQYPVMSIAATLARFGVQADSPWAREIARRQTILCTYDAHETGVVEDGIDGGPIVAGDWFNLAHPWPLRQVMELLAWQPETFGARRENHIMRSSSVITLVQYGQGRIRYSTYDAPHPCQEVLRLAFSPRLVTAAGKPLEKKADLNRNGYTVTRLADGDYIVIVRHDECRDVVIEGKDPQQMVEDTGLAYKEAWQIEADANASAGEMHVSTQAGARVRFAFKGNQVRLLGRVAADGGKADVYLDGVKQLCGIDCWCPQLRDQQVLYYKNGLAPAQHILDIVVQGAKNPLATGTRVYVDALQWSASQAGKLKSPAGGPAQSQRVIFGYVKRTDYLDSHGNSWRPATEFIYRLKATADLVPAAFWTTPRCADVGATPDPELYRYGVHGPDFTAYFTVDPTRKYQVTLKFCQSEQPERPGGFATSVDIQGRRVISDMDIAATAGGLAKAVDLSFPDIKPAHGIIAIRFTNRDSSQAMIQAIEIAAGNSAAKTAYVPFRFSTDTSASRQRIIKRLKKGE